MCDVFSPKIYLWIFPHRTGLLQSWWKLFLSMKQDCATLSVHPAVSVALRMLHICCNISHMWQRQFLQTLWVFFLFPPEAMEKIIPSHSWGIE